MGNFCCRKPNGDSPSATNTQAADYSGIIRKSATVPTPAVQPPHTSPSSMESTNEKKAVTNPQSGLNSKSKNSDNRTLDGRTEKLRLTFAGDWSPIHKTEETVPEKSLKNKSGNVDRYADFVELEHHLSELIDDNPPSKDWNHKLVQTYPVQYIVLGKETEKPIYQLTIHVSDESVSAKRSFLAFYQIQPHLMLPADFVVWCQNNRMYNTISDSINLYRVSECYGPGSTSLRSLINEKGVTGIHMTDRFFTPRGVYRAIVFQARSMPCVYRLVKRYIQRLSWSDYMRVRCSLPDILTIEHSEWKRDREAGKLHS
ncbi:hypothetical protein FBUS_08676 [Fasciolopsis buskii]|uniref:Uncharacterized protein n=1 Tax=Fasciolopsis buskii TaxID=27845 RepID=A0A8E0VGB4_9TREM|nr:hypothetical protein FBUS_08676 [Fasciolopsis buski]